MKITSTILRKIAETATDLAEASNKATELDVKKSSLRKAYKADLKALRAKEAGK